MPSIVLHSIDTAPDASKPFLEGAQKQFGFVPNLLRALAATPSALEAYLTLGRLVSTSSLSKIEQQIVLLTTSVANACEYCVAAHSAMLAGAGLPAEQLAALRDGRTLADPALDSVRALTKAIVEGRGHVGTELIEQFVAAGHRQEQVLEVLVGVAMKTLSNYTNHLAQTPLDPQFATFAWEASAA